MIGHGASRYTITSNSRIGVTSELCFTSEPGFQMARISERAVSRTRNSMARYKPMISCPTDVMIAPPPLKPPGAASTAGLRSALSISSIKTQALRYDIPTERPKSTRW